MDRTATTLAILLALLSLSFAGELKACYRAYLLFLPVAETCISYKRETNLLKASSFVRTINVGKLVKRVYNKGSATVELPELRPKHFVYYQEEGEFKRYQEYNFGNGRIKTTEIHYVKLSNDVERKEEREYEYKGFVDPYTASLLLYRDSARLEQGTIKMFYDDKEYLLPYGVKGRERLETPAGNFITRKVEVYPNIETKGLLKPKGVWYLWIDEETHIPVRMELKFVIGSAIAKLEKLEGDTRMLENLLNAKR
ncbi:MAG: DUF3108 domain-containing protein [Aquificaceae bacterium]|nr:DUF3108 domain-containing protein [Aquificaceae bacterium]